MILRPFGYAVAEVLAGEPEWRCRCERSRRDCTRRQKALDRQRFQYVAFRIVDGAVAVAEAFEAQRQASNVEPLCGRV